MNEWKEGTLDEVLNVVMGQSPKGDTCNSEGIGLPLLNGPTEFGIKFPTPVQFTTDAKRVSEVGDLLFCVRGSTTGRMNWADQPYAIGRGIAAIQHKEGKEFSAFGRALIDYNLPLLLSSSTGSTFPNVSRSQLEKLEILIPPIEEQHAIASVLSSLDDKIDLLHRQNQTLEQMAETLFRQWFLPAGKAGVEEADEGWEVATLYDAIELVGGGTPKTSIEEYWNGDIKWLSGGDIASNHKSIITNSEKAITEEGLNNSSAKLLPKFSTVISARGTVGKYCILSEPMAYSQSNYGIKPKYQDCYFFTYLLINHSVEELNSAAYGSVFDTITTNTFKGLEIAIPSEKEIQAFEAKVEDCFLKILNNQTQIRTLTALRDTLLPKLMSGEVRVEMDARAKMEEA